MLFLLCVDFQPQHNSELIGFNQKPYENCENGTSMLNVFRTFRCTILRKLLQNVSNWMLLLVLLFATEIKKKIESNTWPASLINLVEKPIFGAKL